MVGPFAPADYKMFTGFDSGGCVVVEGLGGRGWWSWVAITK